MYNNYSFLSQTTDKLIKKKNFEICNLKNSFWKYGKKKQFLWFKKNINKHDVHNLVYLNKILIGYNLLRKRVFYIKDIKYFYFYFDTLIIHSKYRNQKIAQFLLNINNEIFKKKNLHSFLICKKNHIEFYKKFNWSKIQVSNFEINDHAFNKDEYVGMINNFNQKIYKNKKIYFLNKIN